jgi:hypothetical protein
VGLLPYSIGFKKNVEEELPTHPKTAPKYHLVVQWVIREVVGVENALPSNLCHGLLLRRPGADPPQCSFASVRAYNAIRHKASSSAPLRRRR